MLPGISTEQLRSRLNRMVADGMLTRTRYREVPPRVDYELTDRARALMPVLGELARWGYEWVWSSPRALECVDLGAIFRLTPGLLRAGDGTHGSVELTISDGRSGGEAAAYTVTFSGASAMIEECTAEHADARVMGSQAAWVSAFSPLGDPRWLEITGDRQLAATVLARLAPRATCRAEISRAVA